MFPRVRAVVRFDPDAATRILARGKEDVIRRLILVLELAGQYLVEELQTLTNQVIAPARRGGPARYAHLGGWGNITGELEASYTVQIVRLGELGAKLLILNFAAHAKWVEQHEALWVVSGALDAAIFAPILERARAALEPDWRLTYQPRGSRAA
jgi:hypothetical protein